MIRIKRTDASDRDFIDLVAQLDKELATRDGEQHEFYDQFNKIFNIKSAIVLYSADQAIGCGAIKKINPQCAEVKRMYIKPDFRGKGHAMRILSALEDWAFELGHETSVLETGKRQPEAISLYKKCGYRIIPNYGQYKGIENSVCFEKHLNISAG